MIAVLALAAVLAADPCVNGPVYQIGSYPCDTAALQLTPCRCGEYLSITVTEGAPELVQILRGPPGGSHAVVGSLKRTPAYADEDGSHPSWLAGYWFPWRDSTNPPADVDLEYCALFCNLVGGSYQCSAIRPEACTLYRRTASEYLCYDNRRRVPC